MPELPEVEAARKAIEDNCLGKKIKKAIIANDSKVIDGVSPSDFEAALVGKTLISALRKGKNLWLQLDSPPFPSFQFGMAGAIYIKGVAVTKYKRSAVNDTDEWPSKYSKLFIELDDGLELSFTDKRRFAKVRLLKDPASVPPISELGPDALLEPMTVDEFYESLRKKKIAIKALLLDQTNGHKPTRLRSSKNNQDKQVITTFGYQEVVMRRFVWSASISWDTSFESFISGIGNWIADEVLYQARIHPLQVASSLSKESCATLNKCIKEVIEKAIEVGADSNQFPNTWIFHSREKKPGKAFVDGKKIDFITAGGRTTAYVPELQKLSGGQAAKVAGKPKRQTSKRKKGEDDDGDEGEDDANEPASEEEETAKTAKSKRELKPRGHVKKPPTKRKSKASDDDGDENNGTAPDDNDGDEDDDQDQKKKPQRVTNNKQAKEKKVLNKKASNQNSRKPNKKVK